MARRRSRRSQQPGSLGVGAKVLPITLPAAIYNEVERVSTRLHVSKAQLIREAIDAFLAAHAAAAKKGNK